MKYVVAQLGARMHYAVPRILWNLGSLTTLYTDIAAIRTVGVCSRASSRVGVAGIRRLRERVPPDIPEAAVRHFPAFGLLYRLKTLSARTEERKTAVSLWAGAEFCRRVARAGFGDATAVYVFSSMGEGLLEAAKQHGLHAVLEQINAPRSLFDRLYREEDAAWPGWEVCPRQDRVSREFVAREEAEWKLADTIICGSSFVAESLAHDPSLAAKCSVVPYGIDHLPGSPRRRRAGGGLNVLFCGRVSLIKGVPYLAVALDRLQSKRISCRVVGHVFLSAKGLRRLKDVADVIGVVPRSHMRALYEWADVFVLPTLCEGSATVCYEALASGLPVITTPNAGSVVRDGMEGYILPIRDGGAIASALERLATDGDLYEQMSQNAVERAAEFTLDWYATRLSAALGLRSEAGTCEGARLVS